MSPSEEGVTRQRQREARSFRRPGGGGLADPPRQRRPALAALAVLLIVGGALGAGLVAIRMDARAPVLVAARDIPPGTQITAADLAEAQVASDVLPTIEAELADQVVGAYATTTIPQHGLVEERVLSAEGPVGEDREVVAIPLNPTLTPADELVSGDLVRIYRVSGGSGGTDAGPAEITTALVLSITRPRDDELGVASISTANVLVPASAAGSVIDASSNDRAGMSLVRHGEGTDVELEPAEVR